MAICFSRANIFIRNFNNNMILDLVRPEVRFSQSVAKGSAADRHNKVVQISDKIFQALSEHINKEKISVEDMYSVLDRVLPESKPIRIVSYKKDGSRCCSVDYIEKNGAFVGQEIAVPIKKRKMESKYLPMYMHELTHALDILFNPKYTLRTKIMEKTKMYDTRYDKFFDETLYRWENFSTEEEKSEILKKRKKEMKKLLSHKTLDEKINCVQEMRGVLISEINAYNAEKKYALQMEKKGQSVCQDSTKSTDAYLFKEKLKLLNELCFSIIKSERNNLKKKKSATV